MEIFERNSSLTCTFFAHLRNHARRDVTPVRATLEQSGARHAVGFVVDCRAQFVEEEETPRDDRRAHLLVRTTQLLVRLQHEAPTVMHCSRRPDNVVIRTRINDSLRAPTNLSTDARLRGNPCFCELRASSGGPCSSSEATT